MVCCSFCDKESTAVKKIIASHDNERGKSYICNECIEISHTIIRKEFGENLVKQKSSALPSITPETIKAHLDQYVVSQDEAKQILSVAVYNHYKRMALAKSDTPIEKSNILLLGPSGVGKTLLIKTMANYLSLPIAITDATSLTEAGYVGEDVESILERLIHNADGDIERAKYGIVYVDEIDKKVSRGGNNSAQRDVSGEGVQQSLLKIVEGTVVKVQIKNTMSGETVDFDTTNILFIAGGAFIDIDKTIARERRGKNSIGFASLLDVEGDAAMQHIKSFHLIEYGMIPEFVGRFPIIASLRGLDEDHLVRILQEPKNNLIGQFKLLFELDNVTLEFSEKFIKKIAHECIEQKIGARGLRSVLEKSLLDIQYTLPTRSASGVNAVYINDTGLPEYKKAHRKKGTA